MGQLGNIVADNSCDRFFHPYDIVGLVHTGIHDSDAHDVYVSSYHTCIYYRNRPLSPKSGGHAIFVKRQLAKFCSIVADRIEYGVVWIKVLCSQNTRKALYVAFIYLPPQASTYHTQIHGVSYDDHLFRLQQDITFFQREGQVLLMGDFNARIGRLNEWDLLDPHMCRHCHTDDIMSRVSKDPVVNSAGRRLIALCETTCVYLLNGRSKSDSKGAISFRHIGGRGLSTIDYALASRDLAQVVNEGMLDFAVIPIHLCPVRADGGRYDHCPINTHVRWEFVGESRRDKDTQAVPGHTDTCMRWRPQFRILYIDIVQTDGIVLGHLSKIKDSSLSVQESCDALTMAITRAAEVLHERVGGVFVTKGHGAIQRKERWLSREAREIRTQMKQAERALPGSINVVKEL